MNFPHHIRSRRSQGFTLVELVVVLAIMVVLGSLTSLALKSLTGSTSLTAASDMVTGILAFARQEAISKNTLTAVVLITDPTSGDAAYRAFSVWEYSLTSSAWLQVSKWKTLPEGTIVDYNPVNATSSSFLTADSTAVTPALTGVTFPGSTSYTYAYHVFLPSGRLYSGSPNPCTLMLVEGAYKATSPIYTHPNSAGNGGANYVTYYISLITGEAKIVRL